MTVTTETSGMTADLTISVFVQGNDTTVGDWQWEIGSAPTQTLKLSVVMTLNETAEKSASIHS